MAYSEKVLDHYENPRNVGSFAKDDPDVATGMVGAPACGDVMKLQIKVDPITKTITDAKFKTYGCFTSNAKVNTPTHEIKISDLSIGDTVLAWNGREIIPNTIKDILIRAVPISDLLVLTFQRKAHRKNMRPNTFDLICTKEHVFWNANNQPILAEDVKAGNELYEITEYELRKLTNNRHRDYIKQLNSERMIEFNNEYDHSLLPQNNKGYQCKDPIKASKLKSEAAIKNWGDPEYRSKWSDGMSKINWDEPTMLEQQYIELFNQHNVAVKYSAGRIWVQTSGGPASPDFIVPGKKKCIEVYTKNLPKFMQDRSDESSYIKNRSEQLKSAGFDTLFLALENFDTALEDTQNFIHNGMEVVSVSPITHKNQLRGCKRDGDDVLVYDLKLNDGAHVYFTKRVGSHNCGSAIASSSLVTEWVKGKTLDEAGAIKNSQIAEELALPPVKIHCSILAEDAIKSAIEDYRKNHNG